MSNLVIEHTHDNTSIVYISLPEISTIVDRVYDLTDVGYNREYFMYSLASVICSNLDDEITPTNYLEELEYNLHNNYRIHIKYKDGDTISTLLKMLINHIRNKVFFVANKDSYKKHNSNTDENDVYVVSEMSLIKQPSLVLRYYNVRGDV